RNILWASTDEAVRLRPRTRRRGVDSTRSAQATPAVQIHHTPWPCEWHRAVAPGVEVAEITTQGLALSRLKHGFESRWGHHAQLLRSFRNFLHAYVQFPGMPLRFVEWTETDRKAHK